MVLLGAIGILLLFGARWAARGLVRHERWGLGDTVGVERALRIAGILLVILALLIRPTNPDTAAFPPRGSRTGEAAR